MTPFYWFLDHADLFVTRLALLLVFFTSAALVELVFRGRRATRWREYASILLLGAVGALVGAAWDAATATLSPDYFVYGKGVARGASLLRDAMLLGARAGFTAGCVAAALLWMANSPGGGLPLLPPARIARHGVVALVHAVVVGGALGAVASVADLPAPDVVWAGPPLLARRFAIVWWIHAGGYAGLLIGVVRGAIRLRRERRAAATPEARPGDRPAINVVPV
jgi:hypothetical protein